MTRTAATVTIKAPGAMTKEGREEVASWLRMHAARLESPAIKFQKTTWRGCLDTPNGDRPPSVKRKKAKTE